MEPRDRTARALVVDIDSADLGDAKSNDPPPAVAEAASPEAACSDRPGDANQVASAAWMYGRIASWYSFERRR